MIDQNKIYTFSVREVAQLYSVSFSTIVRRIQNNILPAIVTPSENGKPHYRISIAVLREIVNDTELIEKFTEDIVKQRQIERKSISDRKLKERQKKHG